MPSALSRRLFGNLRSRLIWLFAAGGFAAWIFSGTLVTLLVERGARNNSDMTLGQSARILLRLAGEEYREDHDLHGLNGKIPLRFRGRMIQIRDASGKLLLRTGDAPDAFLADPAGRFSDLDLPSGHWRVGSFTDPDSGLAIQIADHRPRYRKLLQLGIALLAPLVIGLPIVMLGAWLLAARALKPLQRAARQLGRRKPSDLSPIGVGEMPREIASLVAAFNHLLHRLGESWEDQRRFAASVAHELRTPLAGLRLNGQRLLTHARHPDMRRQLTALIAAVDEATRMIEQLMALAVLERTVSRGLIYEPLDAARIVEEIAADFANRAEAAGVRFEVCIEAASIRFPSQAFYLIVRNLTESALQRSHRDGLIRIAVGEQAGSLRLRIETADGDISANSEEAGPAADRPIRIVSDAASQLGVDLVRRIAAILDGKFDFCADERTGIQFRFRAATGSGAPAVEKKLQPH